MSGKSHTLQRRMKVNSRMKEAKVYKHDKAKPMDKKTLKIVQLNAVYFKADAISNIAMALDKIHKEQEWQSDLLADLFTAYDNIPTLAYWDYDKSGILQSVAYLISRFIRLDNKLLWLGEYAKAMKTYKPGVAKSIIEGTDIRIWHFGGFYTLFRQFHDGDILYFHGITPPYLSNFSEFGIFSKQMLYAILDMHPFVIVDSEYIKHTLISMGFRNNSIHVLPLFHTCRLPFSYSPQAKPKLLAWGRYARNKGIPELVQFANAYKQPVRIFGDNFQLKEYSEQFREAQARNTSNYANLRGKVPDFEQELFAANIYICNSYHEGFNMPLIEAEAHSLPVLARRGTAMDELVKDGWNGYLFGSVDELPGLIGKIMADYKRMARNAWQHSQGYTSVKYKEGYLRIIDKQEKIRTGNIEPEGAS